MNCDYVNKIIQKYSSNNGLTINEKKIYSCLSQKLNNWFTKQYNQYLCYPKMIIINFCSRTMKTAINGKYDTDTFLSVDNPNNENALQAYYNDIYLFLKNQKHIVRKQNILIWLKYNNCDIDIVPVKKISLQIYDRYNDYFLWSNIHKRKLLINIQKHTDMACNSSIQKEIILLKILKENYKLSFPSIIIEESYIKELKKKNQYNLTNNFLHMLQYISKNIEPKRVINAGNCNNVIFYSLNGKEKKLIACQVSNSFSEKKCSKIIW